MTNFDIAELAIKVIDQLNNQVPVRDAYHAHGSSYRGLFQSSKGFDGSIPFESGLAREALRMLDLAPEIVLIIDEPFTMEYRLDGEPIRPTSSSCGPRSPRTTSDTPPLCLAPIAGGGFE